MTAEECVEFQKQPDNTKFEQLMAAQDEFITSLRLERNGEKFQYVMKEGTENDKYHELPLQAFPDAVKKHYPELENEITALEASQKKVQTIARCYMYGRVDESDPPILKWRYYRIAETDKPLVGYIRPDPDAKVGDDGKVPEVGRVTDAGHCRQGACDFRIVRLNDIDRDAVRLVYRFKPMSMVADPEAAPEAEASTTVDGRNWAKETRLLKLKLKRTGEWFGKPEIYFLVLYYKDGKFIRMDTVDVDWATEKGMNEGNTELLFWRGADQVRLVLKERDLNISFVKVLKFAVEALKIAGVDTPWFDVISSGVNALPEGSDIDDVDPRDITVRGELSRRHKATYLDDIKVLRSEMKAKENTYPMFRGARMTVTSIMYADVHDEH
ncbi:hypothetical protein [Endozoicomonas lisbonensis]